MRKFGIVVAGMAIWMIVLAVPAAQAEITSVLGGEVTCDTQGPGPNAGERWCGTGASSLASRSTAKTFDGVPIDVNVAFPPEPGSGPDGPYPLVMVFHGYAGSKYNFPAMQRWLNRGYAVFSMTDRGFNESCGTAPSRLADPTGCADGYVRLLDTRYEVRDAQTFAGKLADENLILPKKIASTGGSYGGGLSTSLAALRNRVMKEDGTYVPWKSPEGKDMEIAVATPSIPWTDLSYSLVPNGNTLDYLEDASYFGRFGVMKESWVNFLYTFGSAVGFYVPQGEDLGADLTGWKAILDAGEPYDGNPAAQEILKEIQDHHSSYYIDHSIAPAPLLMSSGFTDDLFPVDEVTRFYNRTRAEYPNNPIALFLGPNSGHFRGMSKADVAAALTQLEDRWIDHYLKGEGSKPAADVTAYLQTCPDAAPSDHYNAKDWASIAPGEISTSSAAGESQVVGALSGSPLVATAFASFVGGPCGSTIGTEEPGSANYEVAPAPAGGYTVLGAPTVIADINLPGANSQIAARLVDVAPNGATKTLIARGLWRPASSGRQVFQLHANGWKVEPGHVARLELLARDAVLPLRNMLNYGRPSNGQQDATITNLELRIPVAEKPGAAGGLVTEPQPKVLPDRPGAALAPGYEKTGSVPGTVKGKQRLTVLGPLKAKGKKLSVKVRCGKGKSCPKTTLVVRGRNRVIAARKGIVVAEGRTRAVKLSLTRQARQLLAARRGKATKRFKVKVAIRTVGSRKATVVRQLVRTGRVR